MPHSIENCAVRFLLESLDRTLVLTIVNFLKTIKDPIFETREFIELLFKNFRSITTYYYIPIQRTVVAYGRHHDDFIRSEFPNFINEGMIHEVGASDTQVQYVDLLEDGVVKCIQEPRGVGNL